jgi:alkyl sulfatase BDS1-like metallo-beta-lactamase superfamily hydrolase
MVYADFSRGGGLQVSKFLSPKWFDQCRRLAADFPERPGAGARIQYVLQRSDGEIHYSLVLEDGRLVSASLGDIADPDVTLTLPYADSLAIHRGELDPNQAFREGRIKFSGMMQKLMSVMPILWPPPARRPASAARRYRAFHEQLREVTEF